MTPISREFSPREQQIVDALLQAKQVKDIARELALSVNTVKDYLKTIYRKAQVHSSRELMRLQLEHGGVPAAPPVDTGLAQLLRVSQGLEAERSPREALSRLAEAVRKCTRARRVTYWRWVRQRGELALAPEGLPYTPAGLLQHNPFLTTLRVQGFARWEPGTGDAQAGTQFRDLGLSGEVIGALCAPAPRVQVVLASDAAEGKLGSLDGATLRLLARLVHSAPEQAPLVLRASA